MKKIVFKKNINSDKPEENVSNVKMKSFKKKDPVDNDFTFTEENVLAALKNVMDPELQLA